MWTERKRKPKPMGEPIRVIDISKLRKEFDEYYLYKFIDEVLKRTDKRYFTREKIYIVIIAILISTVGFAWHNIRLLNKIKDMDQQPIQKNRISVQYNSLDR